MKKLLSALVLSACFITYSADQDVQHHLPLVIIVQNQPQMDPIFIKYEWVRYGNVWKGVLLPIYHPQNMIQHPENQQ